MCTRARACALQKTRYGGSNHVSFFDVHTRVQKKKPFKFVEYTKSAQHTPTHTQPRYIAIAQLTGFIMSCEKRKADSLDPTEVPPAKEAKKDDDASATDVVADDSDAAWITVRQGAWSIAVLRVHLYACNEPDPENFFESGTCPDTNEMTLTVPVCATRADFMLFFGVMVNPVGCDLDTLTGKQIVAMLLIADYCRCRKFISSVLPQIKDEDISPAKLTAYDCLLLAERFKSVADVMKNRAVDALLRQSPPDAAPEVLASLWYIVHGRLVDQAAKLTGIRDAVDAFMNSCTDPWCSDRCPPDCDDTTHKTTRRTINSFSTSDFSQHELATLEDIAQLVNL
jgi:hypothetical protein